MGGKPKKITVKMSTEEYSIFVLIRRKHKLTDLYPQRAILEESRKNSSLIQANDWIDHDYYEKMVEESSKTNKRIDEKYGARIPDSPSVPAPNSPIKVHEIKPYTEY